MEINFGGAEAVHQICSHKSLSAGLAGAVLETVIFCGVTQVPLPANTVSADGVPVPSAAGAIVSLAAISPAVPALLTSGRFVAMRYANVIGGWL